jgi:uncharacterized membrane protein
MRPLVISVVFSAILFVASLITAPEAAQADLRYCNQTAKDAQVMEGHHTVKDGLTVQGTFNVRKGTCGVIVPGSLKAAKRYYIRVLINGEAYGDSANHLCIYDLAHFTIDDEDSKSFRCGGSVLPSNIHVGGFTNSSMHLADFMSIDTNGEANMVVTQSANFSMHFQLK